MAKNMYIYDERALTSYPKKTFVTKQGEWGCGASKVKADADASIIIAKIRGWCSTGEIETLRFIAHGHPGKVSLGKNGMTAATIDQFKELGGLFAPNATIELHACLVAQPQCDAGTGVCIVLANWCQTLANMTKAKVIAGEQLQYIDPQYNFEGITKTWTPA